MKINHSAESFFCTSFLSTLLPICFCVSHCTKLSYTWNMWNYKKNYALTMLTEKKKLQILLQRWKILLNFLTFFYTDKILPFALTTLTPSAASQQRNVLCNRSCQDLITSCFILKSGVITIFVACAPPAFPSPSVPVHVGIIHKDSSKFHEFDRKPVINLWA